MAGKGGKAGDRNAGVTIIRKEEVIEAAAHGGAWKVAYADFVTAMMAFFLLMWLLNATTEDQRKGLADYFSPNNLMSHASSGTGQPFGGHTVFDQGAMVSDRGAVQVIVGQRPVIQDPNDEDADTPLTDAPHGAAAEAGPDGKLTAAPPGAATVPPANPSAGSPQPASRQPAPVGGGSLAAKGPTAGPATAGSQAAGSRAAGLDAAQAGPVVARVETASGRRAPTAAELRAEQQRREKQAFEKAAEELRQAVQGDPALAGLSRQLAIDITPEGLRIQLLDEERLPMFATGSAVPNERVKLLLAKVAPVLMRLPEDIAVVGHTDAAPYAGTGKTNWELSTERANVTRRLLTDGGLADPRISRVTGLADRDPLLPADPRAAANRRIAIIVLRNTTKPAAPPGAVAAPSPGAPPAAAPHAAASPPAAPGTGAPSPAAAQTAAPLAAASVAAAPLTAAAPAAASLSAVPSAVAPQAAMPRATVLQTATPQTATPQAGVPQAGVPQAGVPQAGVPQAGVPQAGVPQAGVPQTGVPHTGEPHAAVSRAAPPAAAPSPASPPTASPPTASPPTAAPPTAAPPTAAPPAAASPAAALPAEPQAQPARLLPP